MLKQFKEEQDNETLRLGSKWVETDRLFTKWNGEEMNNSCSIRTFSQTDWNYTISQTLFCAWLIVFMYIIKIFIV